ncbi:MAG: oligosaccharide flippase family protein [Oscillospiraceae bacterium]|nr:oligosaccharide flippase family protein [Oscillospiraceae bacterium]
MKKRNFITNSLILTATSVIAKTIGLVFRSFMSEKVGSEGVGLYALVCSIYFFFASFSVSGMSLAVTRLVSDSMARDDLRGARSTFRKCLGLSIFAGVSSSFALFYFSEFIAREFLGDQRAIVSLRVLSVALPFIAFSACFRGYFYASGHIVKTASEQLMEQAIEIIVFIVLIARVESQNVEQACLAIVTGTTVAEAISCMYSYLMYLFYITKIKMHKSFLLKSSKKQRVFRKIFKISVPITASTCVKAGLGAAENMLIPSGLHSFGSSFEKSLSDYGMINGMVMPIIAFPAVLVSAFSNLLVSEISKENTLNNKISIQRISSRVLRFTMIFSAFIMGLFWIFSDIIGGYIYKSQECSGYLFLLCPFIPIAYVSDVINGILKGLNQQMHYLLYSIINSIVCIILLYFLLPWQGMKGLIITIFAGEILNFTLTAFRLTKIVKLKILLIDWFLKPLMCALISCVLTKYLLLEFLFVDLNFKKFSFSIILSLIFYILLLFFINLLEEDEKRLLTRIGKIRTYVFKPRKILSKKFFGVQER